MKSDSTYTSGRATEHKLRRDRALRRSKIVIMTAMAIIFFPFFYSCFCFLSVGAKEGSLADIDHVVLFMQENRAFDHYFGTMAGVRGFSDPNVQVNAGNRPVWYQDVDESLSDKTDYLLPWYLNYLGGTWPVATQCMVAGSNGWDSNHAALNHDLNNKWALNNTPWSWGYFKRSDLPVHFGIAEGWTIGDMYQESVISSTNPNRVSWASGSINVPGGPQTPDQGGLTIDNNETPGCEGPNLNCYPLKWKTVAEFYEDASVTWQVYQDLNNFDDNPFAWFKQFQDASQNSSLGSRGMTFVGLEKFYSDAANGSLPQVSFIIGPAEMSEHPPYQPKDGAWLQQQIVNAVVNGKAYNKTALIISYDETGGFGDHVTPYHAPDGTQAEWIDDPYGNFGRVYTGPGFRLPFYIISPWTRGGHVFTERSDHISQIKFIEQWLAAKGQPAISNQIPEWRRAHMSDLVKAFDFSNPDYSIPDIPVAETPIFDSKGNANGYAICKANFPIQRPPVPYGSQSVEDSLVSERGFKSVRGQLTEGRFLVFEIGKFAVTASSIAVTLSFAQEDHDGKGQRWVIHETDLKHAVAGSVPTIKVSSAVDGRFISSTLLLTENEAEAATLKITDLGNGGGYSIQFVQSGEYLNAGLDGKYERSGSPISWKVYSVT